MRTEIIRDWPGVSGLAAGWNRLLRRSQSDSIFLTWEWMQAWHTVVGHRHDPLVVAVRDESGELCGLAPFYVQTYRLAGVVELRVLRVMGDWPTSGEYPDWIVRSDRSQPAAESIATALDGVSECWDAMWLPNLSSWTGACGRIQAAALGRSFHCLARPVVFSSFELPATADAYVGSLSAKRRRELRRQSSDMQAHADVRFTRCDAVAEISEYLDALFQLHGKRRQTLGDEGSFVRRPGQAQFYRAFAPAALQAGWLRLYALRQPDAFRAVQLGYAYNGVFHGIQDGFDPEFAGGTGNMLRLEVVKASIAEGLKAYDFLGGFTEHKRRWRAQPREGRDLFVLRPGLVTSALAAAGVWPTGRYLRPLPPVGQSAQQPLGSPLGGLRQV